MLLPAGHDADRVRKMILENFDMSLGTGLGKLAGKVFRIGHLGDFNDLTLMGTLAGCEMGLQLAGVPIKQRRRAGGDGLPCGMPAIAGDAGREARGLSRWQRQVLVERDGDIATVDADQSRAPQRARQGRCGCALGAR